MSVFSEMVQTVKTSETEEEEGEIYLCVCIYMYKIYICNKLRH